MAPTKAECDQLSSLFKAGQPAELESRTRSLLERHPDSGFAWNTLGVSLQMQGKDSLLALQKAAEFLPNDADVHYNLGNAIKALNRLDDAETSYRRALQIRPSFASAHYNLGDTLKDLGRLNEAELSFRQALEIKPDFFKAHNNLGNILKELGRFNEARVCFLRVLEIKPDFADAQWNLGLVLLTLGQFQRGWQEYEMRWNREEAKSLPKTPYPCWLGNENIVGKKLLIQFEQGLGDAIQMLRYIPLLEQKNIECWIQIPDSLHRLVARSFPHSKVIEPYTCPEGLDYRVPTMSLPLAMQTFSEQSIPRSASYLIPDDDRCSFWQKQLASTRPRTVGLVWRGNPRHTNDHNRSASLIDLLPLIAAYESIQFVTMQKDLTDAERNTLKNYNNTRILDDELTDFDETTAVMCNMDVVISVDSAPAHLSGALGRSTWILLPFGGEWRWMVDRTDSPWYPSAKLFRQKSIGNWAEVVDNVKMSLTKFG